MERIVVGVDDSVGAAAALAWALDEGRRRSATVEAVHAAEVSFAWIDRTDPDLGSWAEQAISAARSSLELAVGAATQRMADAPPVECRVIEGPPAQVLVDEAKDADLLVVGTRGRGAFTGALLGSVSRRCIERAHCPIVVVPTD